MSEEQSPSEERKNQALFVQLASMFYTAAMQQMGKLINPITQKIERDLDQAKISIDILGMLESRTRGNLSDEEQRFLEHALFELRMNYLDEAKKPAPEEAEEEETPAAQEPSGEIEEEEKDAPEEKED